MTKHPLGVTHELVRDAPHLYILMCYYKSNFLGGLPEKSAMTACASAR